MSLQSIYQEFIARPSQSALTESTTIHYITTGKSLNSRESILSHIQKESKQLKKKAEKVISCVETTDSLVLEIETQIEILTSGSHYLPGLDENFLADQVIVLPVVHFVNFNNGLITQIRLFWDQSTALKQLGVIGRTGRNWPIVDGRDQCNQIQKLVAVCSSEPGRRAVTATNRRVDSSPKRPGSNGSTTSSVTSHISRDPHASLSLFDGSDQDERFERPIAPRAQAAYRPPSRNLTDIISTPSNTASERIAHPLPKARSSFSGQQTYTLGENLDDNQETPSAVEKTPNVNPKKYTHFEFGNGEDAKQNVVAAKPRRAKNGPSWDFEDFVTPEKRPLRSRPDDVRHFGWSDEDESAAPSPVKQNRKFAPRKDVESHFTMKDENTPNPALANITNKSRPDASSQFEIVDNSPSGAPLPKKQYHPTTKAVAKNMRSNWDVSDDDANAFYGRMGGEVKSAGIYIAGNGQGKRKGTENQVGEPKSTGIRIAGNGQGKRKETDNHWGYGDNTPKTNIPGKTAGGTLESRNQTQASNGGFWDY